MPKIFISYRRADSQYVTDSIHDYLRAHFGDDNVFLDVESIPFGVNFRKYLAEQIAAHDVVLVIIGPDWARMMQERADQPNDFVRIEIESALQQGKLVVPVLVKEAKMPDFVEMPAGLSELQWLNATEIRRKPYLEDDCRRLANGIAQYLGSADLEEFHAQFVLPDPFAWVDIPTGSVSIEHSFSGETHSVNVPAFQISKYPITVAQYELFVNDDGYENKDYWTQSGWQWRDKEYILEPHFWENPTWHVPNHPIVGVSWYEAYAFSQWLASKLGKSVNLPTEEQWQHAAQGGDDRLYTWGNQWDGTRCNNSVNQVQSTQTSPVTQYEETCASPYGVVDMVGNIWEWCLLAAGDDPKTLQRLTTACVLHGGSWSNIGPNYYQVNYRTKDNPQRRSNNRGFRVVIT